MDSVPDARPELEPRARAVWRAVPQSLEGMSGIVLAAIMGAIILFGPYLAPYSPTELNVGSPGEAASWEHPFGIDSFGRDIFSRFLSGGRTVVLVPLAAVSLAFLIGAPLGMFGAYERGPADKVIARLFDLMLSLPPLLVVIVLIGGLGRSRLVVILSVALVFAPRIGRIVRGSTQAVVTNEYISAAQARGEHMHWILRREILPNIAAPVIVDLALRLTWAIIFISTLSFLGLGEQAPSSDWGLMIAQSRGAIGSTPLAVLAPAAGIAVLAVAVNLIADSLTRYLNPEANRPGVQV